MHESRRAARSPTFVGVAKLATRRPFTYSQHRPHSAPSQVGSEGAGGGTRLSLRVSNDCGWDHSDADNTERRSPSPEWRGGQGVRTNTAAGAGPTPRT